MQFVCPVCSGKLNNINNSLVCDKKHCFDRAKSGYVNLLTGSKGGVHGDNKLMVNARKDFLEKGYYENFREEILNSLKKYAFDGSQILDCGCGEGYYTNYLEENIKNSDFSAFDISKDAVNIAAKKNKNVAYAVASSFSVPVESDSVDILLEIFSPHAENEFKRILKKDGIMIMAIPLENHLFELKQAVYDEPYKNEVASFDIDGFKLLENVEIKYKAQVNSNEDIKNLFMMTPYYYKTGAKEQARLNTLQELKVSLEFSLLIYKKC